MRGGLPARIALRVLQALGRVFLLIYGLLARSLLYLAALYLCFYFFVNSSAFREVLDPLLAQALPGRMEAASYHWGPLPWQAGGSDLRFITPEGRSVLEVSYADADIDLLDLLSWIAGQILGSEEGFRIHITRAEAERFVVRINVETNGHVEFIDVFDTPGHLRPPRPPGSKRRLPWIRVSNARAADGRVIVAFPHWELDLNVAHAEADIEARDAFADVIGPFVLVRNGRAVVRKEPGGPPVLNIPIGRTVARDFRFDEPLLTFGAVETNVGGALDASFSGHLDTDNEEAWDGVVAGHLYGVPEGLPAPWPSLFEGSAEFRVWGEGTTGAPNARVELTSAGMRVAGVDLDSVRAEGELTQDPATGESWAFALSRLALGGGGGTARGLNLRYAVALPGERVTQRTSGTLLLDDVDLAKVFAHAGIDAAPGPARAVLSGAVTVEAEARSRGAEYGWRAESDLQVSARWPGDPDWPLGRRFALSGRFGFDALPPSRPPEAAQSGLRLTADRLRLRSGKDELAVDGWLSLMDGRVALTARGNVRRFERILGPLGLPGISGRLRVGRLALTGTLARLNGQIRASVENLQVDGRGPGTLEVQASLEEGRLRLGRLSSEGPWGRLEGVGWSRLPWPFSDRERKRLPFSVEQLELRGAELAELFPDLGLRGALNVNVQNLTGDWRRPLTSLRGRGRVRGRDWRYRGHRLRTIAARLSARPKEIVVEDLVTSLTGRSRITGSASLTKDLRGGSLDAFVEPLPMRLISQLVEEDLPLEGRVGLSLHMEGRWRDPRVEGRLSGEGLAVLVEDGTPDRRLPLGDGEVDFQREPGRPVSLTSASFFPGYRLLSGSMLRLKGAIPHELHLNLDVMGLSLAPLLPELAEAQFDVAASGRGRLDLQFGRRFRWSLEASLPAGGLRASLQEGQVEFTNGTDVTLTASPEGFTVPRLQLSGSSGTLLFACGSLSAEGELDAVVGGVLTAEPFRLLGRSALSRLEGRVQLDGGDAAGAETPPAFCDAAIPVAPNETVRLRGPIDDPEVIGRATLLSDLRVQPRGAGREIILRSGAAFSFLPREGGQRGQRVRIAEKHPLKGSLDEGAFSLWGETTLSRMQPDTGALHLTATDLFYAVPKTLNATFNTDLDLSFRDLVDEERRWSRLSGDVDITEAAFYRSFDGLARVIAGTGGRAQETPTKSIVEILPVLEDTELDLRVIGSDVGLRSAFTFGTTDVSLRMDLSVKGTLGRPLIWDRIEVVPGGKIIYRIVRREFEVVRGTLDFQGEASEPYLDLEARTEIEYADDGTTSVSTIDAGPLDSERIVTITVRIKGRYPKIDLELTSDNQAFDQTDLQYFILTGAPRNSARGEGTEQSISLFTEDLANLASKLLLSAFVDAITLGVTPGGGIDWGVIASLGRHLKLRTRMVQEGADRLYRARFEFRITERLSLEGQLKVNEEENESTRTYESKLRYRIPLD